MLKSHPKIYHLGHRAIRDLFLDEVIVEEKVDGSQITFGIEDGIVHVRSRSTDVEYSWAEEGGLIVPNKMFLLAVQMILARKKQLHEGWSYRGEYLAKPKHNTLAYDRAPHRNIILFDICTGDEHYLKWEAKNKEAWNLGLECVPLLYEGKVEDKASLMSLLATKSVLGGQLVEGIVIKNYHRFGVEGNALMGKYVSEAFKEQNSKDWKERHPQRKDVIDMLADAYRNESRWDKAVQHLRDRNELTDSPRDIGNLIKEAQADIKAECVDEIKERLFSWAWPQIARGSIRGLPEWYKDKLAEKQFEGTGAEIVPATEEIEDDPYLGVMVTVEKLDENTSA